MLPLLLLGAALAQDPVPDDEMIVEGDREQAAWDALDETMWAQGYHRKTRRDGSVVYRPPSKQRWKPKIVVQPEGIYHFRSPQVVFQGLYTGVSPPGTDIAGMPSPSSIQLGVRFWMTSRRKLKGHEHRLADTIHPDIREINDAIAARAHAERLLSTITEIEALWAGPGTPADKRAQLAALWLTRLGSPEGLAVRALISDFITEVVTYSEAPYTQAELDAIRAACGCSFPAL